MVELGPKRPSLLWLWTYSIMVVYVFSSSVSATVMAGEDEKVSLQIECLNFDSDSGFTATPPIEPAVSGLSHESSGRVPEGESGSQGAKAAKG